MVDGEWSIRLFTGKQHKELSTIMAEFLNHGNRSIKVSEIAEIETVVYADSTVVKLWGRRPEPLVVTAPGELSISDVLMILSQVSYNNGGLDVYWDDLLE